MAKTTLRTEDTRKAIQELFKGVTGFHITGACDNAGGMFAGQLYGEGDDNKPLYRSQVWIEAKRIVIYVGKATPIYNAVANAYEAMNYDRTTAEVVIRDIKRKKSPKEDVYQLPSVDEIRKLYTLAGVIVPPKASKRGKGKKNNVQESATA